MADRYSLRLVEPGGSAMRDVTGLVQSMSWIGDIRQTARELRVSLVAPRDGSVESLPLEEGAALILSAGDEVIFTGQLLTATTSTQTQVADLSALDGGRFLAGNQGFYSFSGVAPEAAAAAICGEFGIPTGSIAAAGTVVSRKYPGVALDKILMDLYTRAGEQTGRRFFIRFTGRGELEVREKPTAASLTIRETMSVTNTWSVENLCNRVAIYSDTGALLRVVEDGASQALNGRLQRVLTQGQGEDMSSEAAAVLEDYGPQQKLTVELLEPPLSLITGEAVILQDTGSGVSGLFWVDGDTHTWKNGNHYGKFTLNFRNIMDETTAGRELK